MDTFVLPSPRVREYEDYYDMVYDKEETLKFYDSFFREELPEAVRGIKVGFLRHYSDELVDAFVKRDSDRLGEILALYRNWDGNFLILLPYYLENSDIKVDVPKNIHIYFPNDLTHKTSVVNHLSSEYQMIRFYTNILHDKYHPYINTLNNFVIGTHDISLLIRNAEEYCGNKINMLVKDFILDSEDILRDRLTRLFNFYNERYQLYK